MRIASEYIRLAAEQSREHAWLRHEIGSAEGSQEVTLAGAHSGGGGGLRAQAET